MVQLNKTGKALRWLVQDKLEQMTGTKYLEALELTLEQEVSDEILTKPRGYFNSIAQTIISPEEIEVSLIVSQQITLNRIAQTQQDESPWTVKSVDGHYINFVTYQPLAGSVV